MEYHYGFHRREIVSVGVKNKHVLHQKYFGANGKFDSIVLQLDSSHYFMKRRPMNT